jgi:hypothetical protein
MKENKEKTGYPVKRIVGLLLSVIEKCPWGVNNLLAIKRIIITAFPASMAATVSDAIK